MDLKNPKAGGSIPSKTVVSNYQTRWYNNSENNFYFTTIRSLNYTSGTSLGRQIKQWEHLIMNFSTEDDSSTTSRMVSKYETTWHNNPESCNFCRFYCWVAFI